MTPTHPLPINPIAVQTQLPVPLSTVQGQSQGHGQGKGQYQCVFEKPERFRTNGQSMKIVQLDTPMSSSTTSSSSSPKMTSAPTSSSATPLRTSKVPFDTNIKNLPSVVVGEKDFDYDHPSYIDRDRDGDRKMVTTNICYGMPPPLRPSASFSSSSSSSSPISLIISPDTNQREEYTPCPSTTASRATTAVFNPITPHAVRRHSVFVKGSGPSSQLEKIVTNDNVIGKKVICRSLHANISASDDSADNVIIDDDNHDNDDGGDHGHDGDSYPSTSIIPAVAAVAAAVATPFNIIKVMESQSLRSSSSNLNIISAKLAWGGMSALLSGKIGLPSCISSGKDDTKQKHGLQTPCAVISDDDGDNNNNIDDDDDDNYSDDMEIEEEEEEAAASNLESKSQSEQLAELTDDEIGEDETDGVSVSAKMDRRKSSLYVPTDERVCSWRRDPENVIRDGRKVISPSRRIRVKKEENRRFNLSGSNNTSLRGDAMRNVDRGRDNLKEKD